MVEVLLGDQVVVTVRADRYRADLEAAGKGDGCHGFLAYLADSGDADRLPTARLPGGRSLQLLAAADTAEPAESGGDTSGAPADDPVPEPPRIEGAVESAAGDEVVGWARIPGASSPLEIEVLHGGQVIGAGLAILRRPDVVASHGGNERCGFRIRLDEPPPPGALLVRAHQGAASFLLPGAAREAEHPLPEVPEHAGHGAQEAERPASTPLPARIHVEGLVGRRLSGWGWSPQAPEAALTLSVAIDGETVATVSCEGFRRDLAVAAIRGGHAEFEYHIPERFLDDARHHLAVHAPEAVEWPGYATEFRLLPEFDGVGARFGAGQVLFAGRALPDAVPAGRSLAGIAINVIEGNNILDGFRKGRVPPTIVIPVHNAHDDLRRCLGSLARCTTLPARVLAIDDASTDPRIRELLEGWAARHPRLEVRRNPENLGYTRTVNLGVAAAEGDVVLLNSDTVVTPRWLEKLMAVAYRHARVGTVTPLSDNAGAFSVPGMGKENRFPPWYTPDQLGRAVGAAAPGWNPSVPTGNGFCLYIRRDLIRDIGLFDEDAFPRGYGEENDFCMRARRGGWENLIADGVLVLHARSRSFGDERAALSAAADRAIAERYPDYRHLSRVFLTSPLLREAREAARGALEALERAPLRLADAPRATKPRILYVLHDVEDGGTAFTSLDLMRAIAAEYAPMVFECRQGVARLHEFDGDRLNLAGSWTLNAPPGLFDDHPSDYAAVLTTILMRHAIELVHVRHLIGHSLDAPAIAAALNIPVVLSFHDFYHICPTVNLLDAEGRYCAGTCAPGQRDCGTLDRWPEGMPPLRDGMVHEWRRRVRDMLRHPAAFVTTCESARRLYESHFPQLRDADFRVIEHGRDFPVQFDHASPPVPGEPVRIAVLGHMTSRHKGGEVVKQLRRLDADGRLEFHFLGNVSAEYEALGHCHGAYGRDELPARLAAIRPSFVGLFALWPETYSHTLSESWACGIPVIGSELGAIGERIRRWGGGWTVDTTEPAAVLDLVLRVAASPDEYARQRASASTANLRRSGEMGRDYRVLYKELAAARRHMAGEPVQPPVTRVGVVLPPGESIDAPSPALERWIASLRHPAVSPWVDVSALEPGDLAAGRFQAGAGSVVVTPAAGNAGLAASLQAYRGLGARIVCDAGLPHPHAGEPGAMPPLEPLADVSIRATEEPVECQAGTVDERPWLWAAARLAPRSDRTRTARAPLSVVVAIDGLGEAERAVVAAASAAAMDTGGPWRMTLLGREQPRGLPEAVGWLQVPADAASSLRLAAWVAETLPGDLHLALAPSSRPMDAGQIGLPQWALLGIPCLASASHSLVAALEPMVAGVVGGLRPDAWLGQLRRVCAEWKEPPSMAHEAVVGAIALRHQARRLLSFLNGGIAPAHGERSGRRRATACDSRST